MTNPNKSDSDGDGLNDKDELFTFRTDANKADTDGDTLNDGAELNIHKTDPLKADSDGDGLNDGDEVNRHRTNALVADSDGGTVNDGVEVNRGTNPLDRNDDIPKAPPIEIGKAIVLEGIVFASGKADITPESEVPLQKAFESLRDNPDISVEIAGHTDNTGRKASNVTLSQKRADAVKTWFVGKGIDAGRISTRGYGPDRPIAPNTTPEGRQQNRRIEFIRTK
jgi:outer membrane protein OmpA-like peptidoglycan-associated protein